MGGRPCTIAGGAYLGMASGVGERWRDGRRYLGVGVCVCDLGRCAGHLHVAAAGIGLGLAPTGAPPHTYFDLLSVNDDGTRSPGNLSAIYSPVRRKLRSACPGALAPRRSRVRPAAADDERDRGPGHVGDAGTRGAHCRAPSAHRGADWRQGRWRGCAPRPVPFACWAQHHLTARHLGSQIRRGGRGQGRVGRRSRARRRRSQRPAHASTGSRCGTS